MLVRPDAPWKVPVGMLVMPFGKVTLDRAVAL